MAGEVHLHIDGSATAVPSGITVAAALALAQRPCRRALSGALRAPLCGMGVCGECRVRIDGIAHRLACMTRVAPGMVVQSDA